MEVGSFIDLVQMIITSQFELKKGLKSTLSNN